MTDKPKKKSLKKKKKKKPTHPTNARSGISAGKLKYVVPLTDYHVEPLVESQNPILESAQSYT